MDYNQQQYTIIHPYDALRAALTDRLAQRWGDAPAVRRQVRSGVLTREVLHTNAACELQEMTANAGWGRQEISPEIRARIVDLSLDVLLSESLAPDLQLASEPIHKPEGPIHALVFSAFPHVTHELYPLMIDAYVSGWEGVVLGVHERWFDGDLIRRAILLDEDEFGLIEADIADSPRPTSAQALALDLREEAMAHARIEHLLGDAPLLNPSAGAAYLDDKSATGDCWQDAGLPTPRFAHILPDMPESAVREIVAALGDSDTGGLVIKPVDGTEGRDVALYDMSRREEAIQRLLATPETGVLVMEERGTLRFATTDGPVRCTVRLNVCWDGKRAHAESGYCQVSATANDVASRGRGGRVISLTALLNALCRHDGTPYTPTPEGWECLLNTAEEGVSALAGICGHRMPALVGIDLLLDLAPDGNLLPVLLEANPRPAGMSHSRLLTREGPTEEPGVSMQLWEVVSGCLRRP